MIRICSLWLLLVLLMASNVYADVAGEGYASRYYQEGTAAQKQGRLYDAKIAYQKYLLLKPESPQAGVTRARLKEINSQLGYAYQDESQSSAQQVEEPHAAIDPQVADAEITPEVDARAPSRRLVKEKNDGFETSHSGKEPFLQRCYTDFCRKILINLEGIEYARRRNFVAAKFDFEAALKIDPNFKPARHNLEMLSAEE